jgi:hypothetical protein
MADAAVKFSGHMDRMATHIANEGLSATEIVELMRQESEQLASSWLSRSPVHTPL